MQIVIKKHIESGITIEKEECLKSLSNFGLVITDKKNICFKETHNLTANMRMNWRKLFCSSLRGRVQMDNKNGLVKWYLNVDSIIFKILLTWIITSIGMIFLIQIETKSALLSGGKFGFILFTINAMSVASRVDLITKKLNERPN